MMLTIMYRFLFHKSTSVFCLEKDDDIEEESFASLQAVLEHNQLSPTAMIEEPLVSLISSI